MNFIGVDIGTSFIKGAVLNLETRQLEHIQRQPFPDPVAGLPTHFFEVDPQRLVQQVRKVVEDLHTVAGDCAGLLLCSQMHGFVLTDSRWHPLSNVITWRDQRTTLPHPGHEQSTFEVMLEQISEQEQKQLGGGLRAGLPLFTLGWLAAHDQLPKGDIFPLSLPDFVLTQLCDSAHHRHRADQRGCARSIQYRDWGLAQRRDRAAWSGSPALARNAHDSR